MKTKVNNDDENKIRTKMIMKRESRVLTGMRVRMKPKIERM